MQEINQSGVETISALDAGATADEGPLASELGAEAMAHRDTLQELKRLLGIHHRHFDCWLYAFLENKAFNVPATMAKLERRAAMEVGELGTYKITNTLYEGLTRGIIQIIGCDRRGRPCLYVCSARNLPKSKEREENMQSFDMVLSYVTRLRREHKSCRFVMLVNQQDANLIKNMDMPFQASVALRISKYYPGLLERIYIVNMSRVVTALVKPMFQGMPAAVSERIRIISNSELRGGALLQWFDAAVLPVALGGTLDKDGPEHWRAFADTVTSHFRRLQDAVVRQCMGVKEWELEELERSEDDCTETSRAQKSSLCNAADTSQQVTLQSEESSRDSGCAAVLSTQECRLTRDELVKGELIQRGRRLRNRVQSRHRQLMDRLTEERRLVAWAAPAAALLCIALVASIIIACVWCVTRACLWRLRVAQWVGLEAEDLILICVGVVAGVCSAPGLLPSSWRRSHEEGWW